MRLTLQQISSPGIVESFDDIANISGPCTLELSDGEVTLPIRHAIVHLIFWRNFHEFNVPIRKDHIVFTSGCCSNGTMTKFQSMAYKELKSKFPDKENNIILRLFYTICEYNQFIIRHLEEWHGSIDIFQMIDLMDDPEVKSIVDIGIEPLMGTDVVERMLLEANMKLYSTLSKKGAVKNNVLLPYLQSGMVNKDQMAQVFISLGVRTDINDMVVLYPIKTSYMRGLSDIKDYLVDSLASKKSHFYNSVAVRDSQYFSRKQHLLTSSVIKIYPGNCGTTVTVPFSVTTENYRDLIGKNIKIDDVTETQISSNTAANYIGQTINMFGPGTCRHQNGYCEHCGGLMATYLPKELNVGIASATIVVKDITQLILSSKHFSKTNSIIYKMPEEGAAYFVRRNNEVYWKREHRDAMKTMTIGFLLKDVCPLNDLTLLVEDDPTLNEEKFSNPTFLIIRQEGKEDFELPLMTNNAIPFLSAEMLFYMKDRMGDIVQDESMIWIPLDGFSYQLPVFRSVVANNSMMAYMKKAAAFLQTDIGKYTSYTDALRDFSEIIYSKVHVNILHIETMLKAYMVTSQLNYEIPVVTDPNHVTFQINPRIVKNRSVSGELAFQCFMQYISYPGTFVVPRSPGLFDSFFSIK